jgi:hypothetical protein
LVTTMESSTTDRNLHQENFTHVAVQIHRDKKAISSPAIHSVSDPLIH